MDQSDSSISVTADLTSFRSDTLKMTSKSVFIKNFMTSRCINRPHGIPFIISTTLHRNYRDKCEKSVLFLLATSNVKTLFNDHMVRLKIISLYIDKDLKHKT